MTDECQYKQTCPNAQDVFACNDSLECEYCGIFKQNERLKGAL